MDMAARVGVQLQAGGWSHVCQCVREHMKR